MADEMTVSEALDVIIKLTNLFRPLERLQDALLVVSRLEGLKAELQTSVETLELTRTKSFEETQKIVADTNRLRDEYQTLRIALRKQIDAAKANHEVEMHDLSDQLSRESVAAKQKLADELRAEQAKIDALIAKRSDLQRDVRKLEGK